MFQCVGQFGCADDGRTHTMPTHKKQTFSRRELADSDVLRDDCIPVAARESLCDTLAYTTAFGFTAGIGYVDEIALFRFFVALLCRYLDLYGFFHHHSTDKRATA